VWRGWTSRFSRLNLRTDEASAQPPRAGAWNTLGTLTWGWDAKVTPGANTFGENASVWLYSSPSVGSFESLRDDDTKVMPDYPDLGKLNAVFGDCYIECVNDLPGTDEVPFNLTLEANAELESALDRDSSSLEADDFWVVYVLGAYQPRIDVDNDPEAEAVWFAQTTPPTGSIPFQGSAVYLETIRDFCAENPVWDASYVEQQNVAHEVGHQVLESETHTDNTIMQDGGPVAPGYEHFGDADIAAIRGKVSSPGL
jgi:hypothetical protein